ncbi:Hypothetical_protein [Hexamita inflata]|uniref:Hypothetical_protein n=1 Tax=Hexamita inflata TaxID=28002 RepID=A0AA86RE51_9EUKA|nr:Hypothetical protein HINF_LOCUS60688 [Hexamita inflata]
MPSKSKKFFKNISNKFNKFVEQYKQYRDVAPLTDSSPQPECVIEQMLDFSNQLNLNWSKDDAVYIAEGMQQELNFFFDFVFGGKRASDYANLTEQIDQPKEQTLSKLKQNSNDKEESSSIVIEDSSPSISIDIEDS